MSEQETGHADPLLSAIQSLEELVQAPPSAIRRVMDVGRRWIAACLPSIDSPSIKTPHMMQGRLLDAIALIKEHYLRLDDLKSAPLPGQSGALRGTSISLESPAASTGKVSALRAPWHQMDLKDGCQATARELDLFRVKAISLIRNHTTRTASLQEALNAIRNTPIVLIDAPDGMITMQQTIRLFPESYVLEGSFQRNAHSAVVSVPLSGSFHLRSCMQTGHPSPMQHNGWALSECLLEKEYGSAQLRSLLELKARTAEAFRTGGPLTVVAKNQLERKREAFQENRIQLLRMHQELAERITLAAGVRVSRCLEAYFRWLDSCADAYEQLSQVYNTLNEVYFSQPIQPEKWIAAQAAHPARDFVAFMGPIVLQGSRSPNTRFGRQILHALYHQLWNFLCELKDGVEKESLEDSLVYDIRCFIEDPRQARPTVPQQIVMELI